MVPESLTIGLTQDHSRSLTESLTLRCVFCVSAGQSLTPSLTQSHAPWSPESHDFPLLYKEGSVRPGTHTNTHANPRRS